jgi:transcription-repair coupling factor (superfamily II helicase)
MMRCTVKGRCSAPRSSKRPRHPARQYHARRPRREPDCAVYQLRGHRSQFAPRVLPSADPRNERSLGRSKRLEALQSFTELGSGKRLASMDLEIRGAGNLLGAEQHGNLAEVGFETYMEMLEETIEEMRGRVRVKEIDPEIRRPRAATLPEDNVPDGSQRLELYKRLASAPVRPTPTASATRCSTASARYPKRRPTCWR